MIVKLTYFKKSGKYYSESKYETDQKRMIDIQDEVIWKMTTGDLPGLMPGITDSFIVLMDVPDHAHNVPTLLGI